MKKEIIGGIFGAAIALSTVRVRTKMKALKKENKELKEQNRKYDLALDIFEMANKSLSRKLDEKEELLKEMGGK